MAAYLDIAAWLFWGLIGFGCLGPRDPRWHWCGLGILAFVCWRCVLWALA
jgi:hypothetical protein